MKGYKPGVTKSDLKRHKQINLEHKKRDLAENIARAGAKARAMQNK